MRTRRAFLGGLLALPALQARGEPTPSSVFRRAAPPIQSADEVIDIMDFEPLAQAALPPAHFGYIATGADDDRTVVRNHDAFSRYEIRAHRFNDVSRIDTSRKVFGASWNSPIYLSAVSAMRAFHADAELAVARAAHTRSVQFMLSTGADTPLEAVQEARGAPIWQQVYPTDVWAVTEAVIRRAQNYGCSAIVLTVDTRGSRNNESLKRAMQVDSRRCLDCHPGNSHDMWRRGPAFAGIDVSRVTGLAPGDQSIQFIDRVRAVTKVRLVIKGVVTGEDAALAVEHGADAIVVSNHGGRNEETLRASLDCLPEVVTAVRGRVPVFVDGGIRRGTDVFKALALGATAVGVGRPQAWGLAAFGQSGVEAVMDILNRELAAIMRQAGTPSLAAIKRELLIRS